METQWGRAGWQRRSGGERGGGDCNGGEPSAERRQGISNLGRVKWSRQLLSSLVIEVVDVNFLIAAIFQSSLRAKSELQRVQAI